MSLAGRFEVRWAETALRDLTDIVRYIARNNPSNAKQIFTMVKRRAESLALMPRRGRIVPELKEVKVYFYREMIIPPYRLIYRIRQKEILVAGIFDGRRGIEDVLFERITRT